MQKLKIAFIGQHEYFRPHYGNDLDDVYEVFDQHLLHNPPAGYYDALIAFKADINVVFRGEHLPVEIVRQLSGRRIAFSTEPFPKLLAGHFQYTSDSLGRLKQFLRSFDSDYDFIFHYDESSRQFMETQGINVSGYLPLPIAMGAYHPVAVPRTRQLMFLGRSTPHRENFFGALKRDFDFLHFAHGLPSFDRRQIIERDLLPYVSAFEVSLNVHAENELSWEPRLQLMMACGALVVSEPISPNAILQPGVHFAEASNPGAMYQVCENILRDPRHYDDMRHAGREQVRRALNARIWWPVFFESVLSGHYRPATLEHYRLRIDLLEICRKYDGFDHLLEGLKTHYG